MTESKPIESDEQIAERLSKRHCWPHEKISDIYEYGFQAGYLRAYQAEQEKVRELVDLMSGLIPDLIGVLEFGNGNMTDIAQWTNEIYELNKLIKKHGG